jgi:hypothetical protein
MLPTSLHFPEIEELAGQVQACTDELESEITDLSDTITQWQAMKLKMAEQMRRRKGDE